MINRRKVGMTSVIMALYGQGYTRATMARTRGCKLAIVSESQKRVVVRIESATDSVKSESLVIKIRMLR